MMPQVGVPSPRRGADQGDRAAPRSPLPAEPGCGRRWRPSSSPRCSSGSPPRRWARSAPRASGGGGPTADLEWIRAELARVGEVAGLFRRGDALLAEPVPDVGRSLARLRIAGSVLEGVELAALRGCSRRRGGCTPISGGWPSWRPLAACTASSASGQGHRAPAGAIGGPRRKPARHGESRVWPPPGARCRPPASVCSAGSDALLRGLDSRRSGRSPVTVREGRYVIPVRRDSRSRPAGIIHDESGSAGHALHRAVGGDRAGQRAAGGRGRGGAGDAPGAAGADRPAAAGAAAAPGRRRDVRGRGRPGCPRAVRGGGRRRGTRGGRRARRRSRS